MAMALAGMHAVRRRTPRAAWATVTHLMANVRGAAVPSRAWTDCEKRPLYDRPTPGRADRPPQEMPYVAVRLQNPEVGSRRSQCLPGPRRCAAPARHRCLQASPEWACTRRAWIYLAISSAYVFAASFRLARKEGGGPARAPAICSRMRTGCGAVEAHVPRACRDAVRLARASGDRDGDAGTRWST